MKWALRNKTAEKRLKMAIFKLLVLSYMLTTLYISFFYSNSTRGDWKVRSVVHYFSNGSANQHMFGIILNNYLSPTLSHLFHEGDMMQSGKILL